MSQELPSYTLSRRINTWACKQPRTADRKPNAEENKYQKGAKGTRRVRHLSSLAFLGPGSDAMSPFWSFHMVSARTFGLTFRWLSKASHAAEMRIKGGICANRLARLPRRLTSEVQ